MSKEAWLITDELSEAAKSLSIARHFLIKVESDPYYWHWVIVAVHNALMGLMVCALRPTSGLRLLQTAGSNRGSLRRGKVRRRSRKKRTEAVPANFHRLYRAVKSKDMLLYKSSKPFEASREHDDHMDELNYLREAFVDLVPRGFSIGARRLPLILKSGLEMANFLAFESGNIRWPEPKVRSKVRRTLKALESERRHLSEVYGSGEDKSSK